MSWPSATLHSRKKGGVVTMKKSIAIFLAVIMMFSLVACGTINQNDVAVLWSGDGVVHVPDSLINGLERTLYIESIAYKHHGANGDGAVQTQQVKTALDADCAALAVELVDATAAEEIMNMAKAKNVPLVFFNCSVDASVLAGYDKCVLVNTDVTSIGTVQGGMIKDYIAKNMQTIDRNVDGKISYAAFGDMTATLSAAGDNLQQVAAFANGDTAKADTKTLYETYTDEAKNTVELIVTMDDATALEVLAALQEAGFNNEKLKTHCIPLFTVGADADAKAFTATADMTEEELAAFIYNARNLISAGKMAGTAVEDQDAIANAVAVVLRNLIKGDAVMTDILEDTVKGEKIVSIPYAVYVG